VTQRALIRIEETGDKYEPGTMRERGYQKIGSLWNHNFAQGDELGLDKVMEATKSGEDDLAPPGAKEINTLVVDDNGVWQEVF
jgi:hypothetical protein